ncbi:hypothetical protein [Geothrix rubra]|uniref:hypothetical protein n=1 Tax=Geothrix rubra TaxID=2927977 RepID=UPI0025543259|nr:hypothetical protein [Geothrix rubra]
MAFMFAAMSLIGLAGLISCSGRSSHNRPPVLGNAVFDNGGVPFNGAKSFNLQTLTRAMDPEGGALRFIVGRTLSGADIGSLTVSGPLGTFTPRPGVEGSAVFEIVALDPQGAGSRPAQLTVTQVDTKAPQLDPAIYDITAPTTQDVTASIRVTEKEDLPPPPGGWTRTGSSPNWTYSRTYTANITGDPFTLTDRAGNSSTQLVTIANIDRVAPVVEDAAYSTTAPTNQDVVATFRTVENLDAPAGWAKSVEAASGKFAYTKTYPANTAETVSFFDAPGNRTDKVVNITWIDKQAPTMVTFDATGLTSTSADLLLVADEDAKGYLWFPAAPPATEPTPDDVVQHATADATLLTLAGNQATTYPRTGLLPDTPYVAYLVAEDPALNRSAVRKLAFRTSVTPDAPTLNPAPTGSPSGSDLVITWGLSDADGVQFGKVDLFSVPGGLTATAPNASGSSQVTFPNLPRGTYTALAHGQAMNGTTGQWADITSPPSNAIAVPNHAPSLPPAIALPAGSQGTPYSQILPTATDVDSDPVTYALTGTLPAGISFAPGTHSLTGTPTEAGTFGLSYAASDGQGGSTSRSLSLVIAPTTFLIQGNAGTAGTTLTYVDGTTKTVTADASGAYSLPVPYGWSGTVTPAKAGYTFSPASATYPQVLANQAQNYTASAITYTLSGNAGVGGATLTYVDGTTKTVTADASGAYSLPVSYDWSGTVTPSKAGYTFSPTSSTYTHVLANQVQSYTATAITYTLSGNAGVAGATLTYVDGTAKLVTADASGAYSLTVPYGWSGTVTPAKAGYTFSPASATYTQVLANQAQNYTATAITYTLSGNAGVGGATLTYVDGTAKTVTADASGAYSLSVPYGWSGTVTPAKAGYTFSPANATYTQVLANQVQSFTATAITYTLSGNAGVGGATLTYVDGTTKTVTADASGAYSLTVPYGWSGTVTPAKAGYTFTPASRSYANLTASLAGQDYSLANLVLSGSADTQGNSNFTITNLGGAMTSAFTWELYQNGAFLTSGPFQLTAAGTPGATSQISINGLYGNVTVVLKDGSSTQIASATVFVEFHPGVTIKQASTQADPTNLSPILFDVVFDGPVTGFDASGVVITGMAGTPGITVTGSGANYQVAVTGMANGETVSAAIRANAALSTTSGFGNLASRTGYDNHVTYYQINLVLSGSADLAGNSNFTITNLGGQMLSDYTWDLYQNGVFLTSGPFRLTAAGTPGATSQISINGLYGNITVDIKDGTTASAVQIASSTVFVEFHPGVTIKQAAGQADPTSSSPILFDVVFDGPVTGFTSSDVVITGMAGTPGVTVTGSGANYQVAVTGMAPGETVTATIPANVAVSTTSGFGNLASRTGYDNHVTFN